MQPPETAERLCWSMLILAAAAAAVTLSALPVEPGRAHRWLAELQERFPARTVGSPEQDGAIAFIVESLRAAGAVDVRVEELPSGVRWTRTVRNVHARIPGATSATAIVLAAHHDVVSGAPGAIDDGGAIAAILEAARALAKAGPPPCDVDIAIFDGEEHGLLGSKAHLRSLSDAARERLRACIAVELVGWAKDRLVLHTIPHGFAWEAEGVAPAWLVTTARRAAGEAGARVGLGDPWISPWYQATIRVLGVGTGGDDGAYNERGIPGVLLSGSSLLRFYEGYHTSRDGMALVSASKLDDAARALAGASWALGALPADRAPRRLGEPYLSLGPITLGRWSMILIAVLATIATQVLTRDRPAVAATATLLGGVALIALAAMGSVLGFLVGIPLLLGAAHGGPIVARLSAIPLIVQVAVLSMAGVSFGFKWRGGVVETVLIVVATLLAGYAAGLKR